MHVIDLVLNKLKKVLKRKQVSIKEKIFSYGKTSSSKMAINKNSFILNV
jgi:hypothetical protein